MLLLGGGALVALAIAGLAMLPGGAEEEPVPAAPVAQIEVPEDVSAYPAMFTALAEVAGEAGLDEETTQLLAVTDDELKSEADAVEKIHAFGAATLDEGKALVTSLARRYRWADITRSNPARGESPARQKAVSALADGFADFEEKGAATQQAGDLESALTASREEITAFAALQGLVASAANAKGTQKEATATPDAQLTSEPVAAAQTSEATTAAASEAGVTSSTSREFARNISSARDIARQIEKLVGSKPGSGASDEEKENYRIREASAASARQYSSYLDTLEASMRGTSTESEARNSVVKASQTKAYLQALLNRSKAAR